MSGPDNVEHPTGHPPIHSRSPARWVWAILSLIGGLNLTGAGCATAIVSMVAAAEGTTSGGFPWVAIFFACLLGVMGLGLIGLAVFIASRS